MTTLESPMPLRNCRVSYPVSALGSLMTHVVRQEIKASLHLPGRFGDQYWESKPIVIGVLLEISEGDEDKAIELGLVCLERLKDLI